MLPVAHFGLRDDGDGRVRMRFQPLRCDCEALVEIALRLGYVENVQADAAPIAGRRAHGGGNLFKLPASAIQLAVERIERELRGKTFLRCERLALPADQLPPVPIRAHAVELLAHRPACNVLIFVFLRQHQIRAERRLDEKSGKNRYHALN